MVGVTLPITLLDQTAALSSIQGARRWEGNLQATKGGLLRLGGHRIGHSEGVCFWEWSVSDWCERGDSNPHGFTRQILSLCVKLRNPSNNAAVMHVTDMVHTILHTVSHHANQTR